MVAQSPGKNIYRVPSRSGDERSIWQGSNCSNSFKCIRCGIWSLNADVFSGADYCVAETTDRPETSTTVADGSNLVNPVGRDQAELNESQSTVRNRCSRYYDAVTATVDSQLQVPLSSSDPGML